MNQGEGYVRTGVRFSEPSSSARGITNTKISCWNVQKVLDDFRWTIDRIKFDELVEVKKDSAPGPDGVPYGTYMCAGDLGLSTPFQCLQISVGRRYRPRKLC